MITDSVKDERQLEFCFVDTDRAKGEQMRVETQQWVTLWKKLGFCERDRNRSEPKRKRKRNRNPSEMGRAVKPYGGPKASETVVQFECAKVF